MSFNSWIVPLFSLSILAHFLSRSCYSSPFPRSLYHTHTFSLYLSLVLFFITLFTVHGPLSEHSHTHLSLEKINTYALAYEWAGSDKSKSPLMLAAHQDVVPVEPSTIDSWTHPPFSGHFDGEYIWGRGSSDDKASLIGILSAIELLIQEGFKPERTVVLAFGMDEETGGKVVSHLPFSDYS